MSFLGLFKRKTVAPETRERKPRWGDHRIIRTELGSGEVYFTAEVFGWVGRRSGNIYREWAPYLFVYGSGPIKFPTPEAAEAAVVTKRAEEAARSVVSQTVVSTGDAV